MYGAIECRSQIENRPSSSADSNGSETVRTTGCVAYNSDGALVNARVGADKGSIFVPNMPANSINIQSVRNLSPGTTAASGVSGSVSICRSQVLTPSDLTKAVSMSRHRDPHSTFTPEVGCLRGCPRIHTDPGSIQIRAGPAAGACCRRQQSLQSLSPTQRTARRQPGDRPPVADCRPSSPTAASRRQMATGATPAPRSPVSEPRGLQVSRQVWL